MDTTTPKPAAPPATAPVRAPVPGQLTLGWRLATAATWILVFLAWSGVWKASRELGVATWWLGPVGEPRPFPVLLLPFVAPGVMVALALNNARRLPWYGLTAAAVCIAIGIADLSYVRRLGAVEILLGACGAAVSIASLSGRYRAVGDGVSRASLRASERSGSAATVAAADVDAAR